MSIQNFNLIRDYIRENCGIVVGDEKSYLIESRLAQLVVESGCDNFGDFYLKARNDVKGGLRDKIIDAMTTNETLWFRDNGPWLVLKKVIIPEMIKDLESGRKQRIRIWSTACSTGQEPYSMAMLLDEAVAGLAGRGFGLNSFEIVATDISPSVLFMAIAGRYNQISISRGLPDEYRDRYFTQNGNVWELSESIRKRVSFRKFNLQEEFATLGQFDLVFCRNVAIYFSDAFKTALFAKIARVLNPNGYLFLGASESMMGYSNSFELIEYARTIFYRVRQSNG